MIPLTADFEAELRSLGWPQFFIKDYVKSLKISRGSIIRDPSEIRAVVAEMQQFRGEIEGGLCVRRVEPFVADSERRYFVLGGKAFTAYLITAALRHRASELHADFHPDGGRWSLRSWTSEKMKPDEVIAITESKGDFRSVLAHLGACYLMHQVRGGYGEVTIQQSGGLHRLALYMANDPWRGYSLRAFTRSQ